MQRSYYVYTLVFCLFVLMGIPFSLAETPDQIELNAYVIDNANILTSEEKAQLTDVLKAIKDSGKAEIAVVIINTLDGMDEAFFAFEIAEGKLGNTDANNGLLLLVAMEERRYRFEVGRGLEPYFNDAKVGRMGRQILVPAFQDGQYGAGILSVVAEIGIVLEEATGIEPAYQESKGNTTVGLMIFAFMVFTMIALLVYAAKQNNEFSGRRKRRSDDDLFLTALMASTMMRGGRRGGNFGGGFGGFGGGSFGGGGAGGGW